MRPAGKYSCPGSGSASCQRYGSGLHPRTCRWLSSEEPWHYPADQSASEERFGNLKRRKRISGITGSCNITDKMSRRRILKNK